MQGRIHAVWCTLSRISTRLSASTGPSGGGPFSDRSTCDVVETMKGISCASTPSFARSSGVMGGAGNSSPYQWVVPATVGIRTHTDGPRFWRACQTSSQREGTRLESRIFAVVIYGLKNVLDTRKVLSTRRFGHSHITQVSDTKADTAPGTFYPPCPRLEIDPSKRCL